MEYVKDTKVSDTTPPSAPTNVRVQGNKLTWEAEADLESGLASFVIERDGQVLVTVPEQGKNPFGRPIFQNLQYSDTPTQPLVPMQFTDTKADPALPALISLQRVGALPKKNCKVARFGPIDVPSTDASNGQWRGQNAKNRGHGTGWKGGMPAALPIATWWNCPHHANVDAARGHRSSKGTLALGYDEKVLRCVGPERARFESGFDLGFARREQLWQDGWSRR